MIDLKHRLRGPGPQRHWAPLLASALLCACTASAPGGTSSMEQSMATREPAEVRNGQHVLRASIVPTMALSESMAKPYGIARDDNTVLLLVGARRGPPDAEVAIPATLDVRVRDLRGVQRDVVLREIRNAEFIDYAGSIKVQAPDTLTFEIQASAGGMPATTLRFSRDVHRP
jgi:hypothetical protein